MLKLIVFGFLSVAFVSCVTHTFGPDGEEIPIVYQFQIDAAQMPPVDEIVLFDLQQDRVPAAFVETGSFTYAVPINWNEHTILRNLKQIAAMKGADAIGYDRVIAGSQISPRYLFRTFRFDSSLIEQDITPLDELYDYFDTHRIQQIEGIWSHVSDNNIVYQVAIRRDETTRRYIMSVTESNSKFWNFGYVMANITPTANNNVFIADIAHRSHIRSTVNAVFSNNDLLQFGDLSFIRMYPADSTGSFSRRVNSGTGFLLSSLGHIVTNHHVIADAQSVVVQFPNHEAEIEYRILLEDRNNDLAILVPKEQLEVTVPRYLLQPSSSVASGDEVFVIGYPFSDSLGRDPKITSGIISSTTGYRNNPVLLQITNPIQPGNSGGPLISRSGDIVGIVVSSLNASYFFQRYQSIPQNVNFAIKTEYLISLLASIENAAELIEVGQRSQDLTSSQIFIDNVSGVVMVRASK